MADHLMTLHTLTVMDLMATICRNMWRMCGVVWFGVSMQALCRLSNNKHYITEYDPTAKDPQVYANGQLYPFSFSR
jgi:hypothetical protein